MLTLQLIIQGILAAVMVYALILLLCLGSAKRANRTITPEEQYTNCLMNGTEAAAYLIIFLAAFAVLTMSVVGPLLPAHTIH